MKVLLVAAAMLALVACGSDSSPNTSSSTTAAITPTGAASGTTTTDVAFSGSSAPIATPDTAPATLTAIDIGLHDGFERIVFRFSDHLPGIRLQPSPGPFAEDGSGKPVAIEGTAFLALRMTAVGHTMAGQPVTSKRIAGPKGHSITEIVRTGDFEGVLSSVIGLTAPQTFRVLQTTSPPRVIVDISSN